MKYEEGTKRLQFRCKRCGIVSPHDRCCFRCGGVEKEKVVIAEIIPKRNKGQGINVSVG